MVVLLPDGGRGYLSKIFSDKWMADYGFLEAPGEETVGDVLRGKTGEMPPLVHAHPNETVREAIDILREYGVSQLPVVRAEPPVTAGEVVGSVSEKALLDALFAGSAALADPLEPHMSRAAADHRLRRAGDGARSPRWAAPTRCSCTSTASPPACITRQDLLGHLAGAPSRRRRHGRVARPARAPGQGLHQA